MPTDNDKVAEAEEDVWLSAEEAKKMKICDKIEELY